MRSALLILLSASAFAADYPNEKAKSGSLSWVLFCEKIGQGEIQKGQPELMGEARSFAQARPVFVRTIAKPYRCCKEENLV